MRFSHKTIGGHMLSAFFGTALAAWFVLSFFLAPILTSLIPGLSGYNFNILTVITGIFTFQMTSIVFIILWVAFYLGYLGLAFRGGRRR